MRAQPSHVSGFSGAMRYSSSCNGSALCEVRARSSQRAPSGRSMRARLLAAMVVSSFSATGSPRHKKSGQQQRDARDGAPRIRGQRAGPLRFEASEKIFNNAVSTSPVARRRESVEENGVRRGQFDLGGTGNLPVPPGHGSAEWESASIHQGRAEKVWPSFRSARQVAARHRRVACATPL